MVKKIMMVILFLSMIFEVGLYSASVYSEEIGVSDEEILIGSSLALEGHAGYLGTQYRYGALSYLNYINDNGGVYGRKIRVIWYDDGYDPPRTIANTNKLIDEDKVFCLFCYVGTPTSVKIIPIVERRKVPLLGLFTGANVLREPFRKYIINVRSSYYSETGKVVHHAVEDLDLKKIAVFYQYDAYGIDGLKGTEIALKRYGLSPVAAESFIRGSTDIEGALENIRASDAEIVIMIGTYAPCAKFIIEGKKRGFNPIYHNVSFVGPNKLVEMLGEYGEGEIITQVVPPPCQTSLAGVEEYVGLLGHYFPEESPDFVSLEGFINAKVLVEGLRRCGRELTREKFINAIESIKDFDVGIGADINFGPGDHQGLDKIYTTRIHKGELMLFNNWEILKE